MKELNNRELLLLAYLDGDLDAAGKQRAEALMAEDAAFMSEYRLLAGTRLEPETITYAGKNKLKRTAPVKKSPLRFVMPAAAVAACVALFVLLYNPAGQQTGTELTGATTPGKEITGGNKNNNLSMAAVAPEKTETVTLPAKIKQEKDNYITLKKQDLQETEMPEITRGKPVMLAARQVEINVERLDLYTPTDAVYAAPIVLTGPKKKGISEWYTRAEKGVNNILGYLQKPKININRTDEDGQQRLVISLETDKYNVEREIGLSLK